MKKVLVLFIAFFTLFLIGCDNTEVTTYDYSQDINSLQTDVANLEQELQEQINSLELQIEMLEEMLDNIIAIEGLNGQTVYYYQDQITTLSDTVMLLKDTLDKTKVPSYMVDPDTQEYVSLNELAQRLKLKYYGAEEHRDDKTEMGTRTDIKYYFVSNMPLYEVFARTVLLIEEIRNYDFYIIGSTELLIRVYVYDELGFPKQLQIQIPMQVMLNDAFTINLDGIYSQDYEMRLTGDGFTQSLAQQTYDEFILNGTFDGYVLDFK